MDNFIVYESDITQYDMKSFIDIHAYNKVRTFTDPDTYNNNKMAFEIAFFGDKDQYPNVYDVFLKKAK